MLDLQVPVKTACRLEAGDLHSPRMGCSALCVLLILLVFSSK